MIEQLENLENLDMSFIQKGELSEEQSEKIKSETGFDMSTWNEIVELQRSFNNKIDKNWVSRKLDWKTAMVIESAELVDSIDWKWWKKGNTDWKNLEIEMIDLFHFLIAKSIEVEQHIALSSLVIAKELENKHTVIPDADADEALATQIKDIIIKEFIQFLLVDNIIAAFMIWLKVWYLMGYDIEELFKQYKMKYCLNLFRQDNGYKTGEYLKMWNGIEDNVYAQKLIKDIPMNKMFVDNLYERLSTVYKSLNKPKEKSLVAFIDQEQKWKDFMVHIPEGTRKIMFEFVKEYETYLEK